MKLEGKLDGQDRRFAVVVAKFNDFVTAKLAAAAREALLEHGTKDEDVVEIAVPGAFELPLAAKAAADTGNYDAVICVGAVIRGGTPHFDYVAGECARGVANVPLVTGVPAIFGVLTTDDVEQATERAGGSMGNKGRDAALAALEMVNLLPAIREA